jgi:hypothetical protein
MNNIFIYFDCQCSPEYSIDDLYFEGLDVSLYNNVALNLINNRYCNISNIQIQFEKSSE